MRFHTGGPRRALRGARKPLLAAVIASAALGGSLLASAPALAVNVPPPGALAFNGNFSSGIQAWTQTGGGAQCSNYGTPSQSPRLRGSLSVLSAGLGAGQNAGVFTLPSDTSPSTYPLEACELLQGARHLALGTDSYYGYMFYVPTNFTTGVPAYNRAGFWGITTAQFHFQNIWGSPLGFELHNDHMTLSVQTGACSNHLTARPGCQWVSNADNPDGKPGNLGSLYVIPAPMQLGVWHELVMHVHWAADSTGQVQIWHRVAGSTNWTQTVNLNGYPTVQWDVAHGCCNAMFSDKVGAYRVAASAPVSVAETSILEGSSFNGVATTMP